MTHKRQTSLRILEVHWASKNKKQGYARQSRISKQVISSRIIRAMQQQPLAVAWRPQLSGVGESNILRHETTTRSTWWASSTITSIPFMDGTEWQAPATRHAMPSHADSLLFFTPIRDNLRCAAAFHRSGQALCRRPRAWSDGGLFGALSRQGCDNACALNQTTRGVMPP